MITALVFIRNSGKTHNYANYAFKNIIHILTFRAFTFYQINTFFFQFVLQDFSYFTRKFEKTIKVVNKGVNMYLFSANDRMRIKTQQQIIIKIFL